MILEFSVKNFLSFKEKVTFSMIANSNKELNDNYVEIGGNKVLKSAAIYGANASGKSNLFKILTLVVLMLRSSNSVDINAATKNVPNVISFALSCLHTIIHKPFEHTHVNCPINIKFVFINPVPAPLNIAPRIDNIVAIISSNV